MFDEPVRAVFNRNTRPLVATLARIGVSPNQLTAITFAVAASGAVLVGAGWSRAGFAAWLVSRLGDGLDGSLARATGRRTSFGGFLDITLDMVAYSAMVLGFSRLYPSAAAWPAILAAYVFVITTTLALSDAAGRSDRRLADTDRTFEFTPGIAEAGETSVMYGLWVALPAQVEWLAWLWVGALVATGVQRAVLARRILQ